MTEDLSQASFDEILQGIKRGITLLRRESEYYQTRTPEVALENLRRVTALIGNQPISIPSVPYDLFKQQWQQYVKGQRATLDKKTIRYLCWEALIALDPLFLKSIDKFVVTLSAQAIHGLVRACHMKWLDEYFNDQTLSKIRGFVRDYDGPNRIVGKWKENIGIVLHADATSKFAQEILNKKGMLDNLFQEWGIDAQSGFVSDAVSNACTSCRKVMSNQVNHNDFYLEVLLTWGMWNITSLKNEIGTAILDYKISYIQEKFQAFVLGDTRLGDPRLPRNDNWLGINEEAKRKFISWLSRRDIVFFFEHVLSKGKDPHGRKDFWLKYVSSLMASRPLLCEQDKSSLRSQMQREQIDYGSIKGINSAFILDFGTIVAVEFSRVGACYIYTANKFKKITQNLFEKKWFSEGSLRRSDLSPERIVHRLSINCDWTDDVGTVLARYGIRKG